MAAASSVDIRAAVRSGSVWVSGGLVLLAAAYFWVARGYEIGSLDQPGAGFLPQVIGGMFLFGSLVNLFQNVLEATPGAGDSELSSPNTNSLLWRPWAVSTCVAVALFAVPWIGMLVCLGFIVLCTSIILGPENWRTPVYLTIGGVAGTWFVFVFLIGLPLPQGELTGM